MYLANRLYAALADVDDRPWQELLGRHTFWSQAGVHLDADHQGIAFHILMHEGELARSLKKSADDFEFDVVPIPGEAFDDPHLCQRTVEWSTMHAGNFGAGVTTKMGLYVIHAGGTLGYGWGGPLSLVMSYGRSVPGVQQLAGELVRFSVGLEAPQDLLADLVQALRLLP